MAKNLFQRYIWLVETINSREHITLEEIRRLWSQTSVSEGNPLPDRTFHNYREAIQTTFDINIECRKSTNEYYIEYPEDLTDNLTKRYLLQTFSVQQTLSEGRSLGRRVELENIPSSEKHLSDIIRAMRNGHVIKIVYDNFWQKTRSERLVEPYMLKLFKQRWYMVANEIGSHIKVFALDRIIEFEISDEKFTLPVDFVPEEYFADCYGVVNRFDIAPEEIVLKVYGGQVNYFKELPLHSSQTEIEATADYSVFCYRMKLTYDLRRELQFKGDEVEVLAPEYFRNEIAEELRKAYERYNK